MTATLPLISHTDAEAPFAFGKHGMISVRQFLADVQGVARQLPPARHVLNVCSDRYHFAVGLAASIVSGKVSLLPSTHTAETVRQLQAIAPDVFCLSDQSDEAIALPITRLPKLHFPTANLPFAPPRIDAGQVVAQVFTSGSTGLPVPHRKLWGKLVGNVNAAVRSLGVAARPHHLVATVPPQHMYGLESSVLLAMLSGGSFWSGRPFYPADIADAMAAVPEPRMLVTTPVHLRALCDAAADAGTDSPAGIHTDRLTLPSAALVLCATAPLAIELARRGEHDFAAPLMEIYGCTETGQLATRQPTASPVWQLFPEIRLEQEGDTTFALGQWIEGRIALGDLLELLAPSTSGGSDRFILHGRHADLVNLAGKRTSLAYLNHQLTAIPGVSDGAFFVPDDTASTGVTRLVACVVAEGTDRRSIERELRQRIDPIFLPRPLFLVDALPRNATGKLPRPVFQEFIAGLTAATDKPHA